MNFLPAACQGQAVSVTISPARCTDLAEPHYARDTLGLLQPALWLPGLSDYQSLILLWEPPLVPINSYLWLVLAF